MEIILHYYNMKNVYRRLFGRIPCGKACPVSAGGQSLRWRKRGSGREECLEMTRRQEKYQRARNNSLIKHLR